MTGSKRLVVAAALVMGLVLSGCATRTASPTSAPHSGVSGTCQIDGGPAIMTSSGPASPPRRPFPGQVVVHSGGSSGPVVGRVQTDKMGRFRLELPPGTYTLVLWQAAPQTVDVLPGQFTNVELVIHAV